MNTAALKSTQTPVKPHRTQRRRGGFTALGGGGGAGSLETGMSSAR